MRPPPPYLPGSGYLIGFALGGFFDGIVLHQVLQWHHLLSLVDGIGDQLLFDGLFHAVMYLVAVAGLMGLFRRRRALTLPGAGRTLLAAVLIGSGIWHVLDGIVSHWLLGIHRIRIDSDVPLLWDLGWFAFFGIIPILIGRSLVKRAGPSDGKRAGVLLSVITLIGGAWAARPPAGSDTAIALFAPGTSQGQAVNAILAADGRLLWRSNGVWAVRWDGQPRPDRLYRQKALFVSTSLAGAACAAWSDG